MPAPHKDHAGPCPGLIALRGCQCGGWPVRQIDADEHRWYCSDSRRLLDTQHVTTQSLSWRQKPFYELWDEHIHELARWTLAALDGTGGPLPTAGSLTRSQVWRQWDGQQHHYQDRMFAILTDDQYGVSYRVALLDDVGALGDHYGWWRLVRRGGAQVWGITKAGSDDWHRHGFSDPQTGLAWRHRFR